MAGYRAATSLNFAGYSGHIMLMKIRYGYGDQSLNERLTILHNWYSDLRAYLPIIYSRKMHEMNETKQWRGFTITELLTDSYLRLQSAYEIYNADFENMQTFNPMELEFTRRLNGTKEVLDEITAITKVIDKQNISDDGDLVAG